MCFSPEASFIASGGLIAAGSVALKIAKPKERAIALVPLFFGIQQFFEGVQWLHLNRGSSSLSAAYIFLFFAFLLWPVYVPIAMYIIDPPRRKILRWFIVAGAIVSGLYLVGLLTGSATPFISGRCIEYPLTAPLPAFSGLLYIVVVLGAFMSSSRIFFRRLGLIVGLLAFVTQLFYYYAFTSVWCFFAAVTSSLILWYLWNQRKEK